MKQICKTVALRTRTMKNGMLSFYLDYYPGFRDHLSMKTIRHETIGIYIYENPRNNREKEYNKLMTEKAEAIRCRRFESIVNERYDFFDKTKMKGDFLAYFKTIARNKNEKWDFVYAHFEKFVGGKCTFEEVDYDLCNRFRDYLMNAKSLGTGHPLRQNSAAGYWATFRAFLNIAYRNKFIKENPNDYLEKIKTVPTDKETLSLDEIQKLIETPCEIEVLKKAVIFDCLTGLRRSDILRLEWEKICATSDDSQYLDMATQKTGSEGFIFISDKLMEFIGPRGKGLVFKGFKPYMTNYPMKKWFKQAGITKHVTFHGLRHTVASRMVELGVNIQTVQHILAHQSISTTQIYAKHADPQLKAAAELISEKIFEKADNPVVSTDKQSEDIKDSNVTIKLIDFE
jgi:integrase